MTNCTTLEEYNNATGSSLKKTGLWDSPKTHIIGNNTAFAEELQELTSFLEGKGYKVEGHWVSLINYQKVVDEIKASGEQSDCKPVVLNLASGYDLYDGCIAKVLIEALEKSGLAYTGGDSNFYNIGNSKLISKPLLQQNGVPTASFVVLHAESMDEDIKKAEEPWAELAFINWVGHF